MLSSTNLEIPSTTPSTNTIASTPVVVVDDSKSVESSAAEDSSNPLDNIDFSQFDSIQKIELYLTTNYTVDSGAFYLKLTKSDSFDSIVTTAEILSRILDCLYGDEVKEVFQNMSKEKLHSILHTMPDLKMILNTLDITYHRDFLRHLGIDFVKNLIFNETTQESGLSDILDCMMDNSLEGPTPNSIALTFLREDLGIDYVRSLTNHTDKLGRIILSINDGEQVFFLEWLGIDFILKNMTSKIDGIISLLRRIYHGDKLLFLECFTLDIYKDIITDVINLRTILEELAEPIDSFSFLEFLTFEFVFQICDTQSNVNMIAEYLRYEHKISFLQTSNQYIRSETKSNPQSSSSQVHQSSNKRKSKIDAAIEALIAGKGDGKLPAESNSWIHVGCEFLEDLNNHSYLRESDIDIYIAKIMLGSLIAAAAYSEVHAGNFHYTPLTWNEMRTECKLDDALAGYDCVNDPRFKLANKENPAYDTLIHRTGEIVFSGKVPYDHISMKQAFPELPEHLDVINALMIDHINNQVTSFTFPTLEELAQKKIPPTPYQKVATYFDTVFDNLPQESNPSIVSFNENMTSLRNHVLRGMQEGNVLYDYDNCIRIGESCHSLIEKVSLGTVTKFDCNKFFNDTYQFHTDKAFEVILKAILGAITGMILGAAVGFLAGNVLGAAIGAGIGFFTGGFSAGAIALESKSREDAFIQVYRDARNVRS